MTLTKYSGQYEELFSNCVLWFTGYNQTNLGFPILPAGVTVTPNGTWTNDLNLGNGKSVETFDGSTNYISLTDNDAWDIINTNAFSICGWFRLSSLITSRICSQGTTSNDYWRVSWGSTNVLQIMGGVGSVEAINYRAPLIASVGTWYYFTIVKSSGIPGTFNLYINGVLLTTTILTAYTGATYSLNDPFSVGYHNTIYWFGNIKDFMIFKGRALTQSEITTLMRLTEPGKRDITPILPGIRGVE